MYGIRNEWILNNQTTYAIKIDKASDDTEVSVEIEWYEIMPT